MKGVRVKCLIIGETIQNNIPNNVTDSNIL